MQEQNYTDVKEVWNKITVEDQDSHEKSSVSYLKPLWLGIFILFPVFYVHRSGIELCIIFIPFGY